MSAIDLKRLASDLNYWNRFAPDDEATHYCTKSEGFEYLDYGSECDIPKPGGAESEITTLRQQLSESEARCVAMEIAIRKTVKAAPNSGPLWFQSEEIKELRESVEGNYEALILRAQADAMELIGDGLDRVPGVGLWDFDEFKQHLYKEAKRLRNQADELEKAND